MMKKYPRGSEWCKWDLQVQTRLDKNYGCLGNLTLTRGQLDALIAATGLSEAEITAQEKTISPEKYAKLFVKQIELLTDLSVVAVTDHNTGAELDAIIKEAKSSARDITILPGVEVSSSHGIHILCLFNPLKPWRGTWKESIDHFLTEIGITGTRFGPQGQPVNATVTSQQILEIADSKGGICIFAHIGTENGLFYQSSTASGGTAHSDIYTHDFCQIVQLPRTAIVSVGVGNIINGRDPNYGKKHVAQIKCSDARKLTEIGNGFVWIKAAPTFEGLKQIVYEPEERVFVGSTPPDNKDKSKVISSISIRSSGEWFADQTLELNRDLVCIIGGKGSGKTALVDLLGLAGGDFDAGNKSAFLNKANAELEGTKLLLKWEDGKTETELEITNPLEIPIDQKVRYLSQSFVESLCSFDRHEQLEREIEGILFQYIPGTETLGAESFESLKLKKTEGVQLEIDSLSARIREHNEDIFNLNILIESRPQFVRDRDQLDKDITELHKQKPQPSNEEERKNAEDLRKLNEQRAKVASAVEQLRIKLNKLEVLKRRLGLISESVEAFNAEIRTTLNELGETDLIADVRINLPGRASQVFAQKIQALAEQATALDGAGKPIQEGVETVASLDLKIIALNQKSTAEVQKKNKLQEFNRRIAEHVQKRDALTQKITAIEQTSRKDLDVKLEQRKQLFLSFFKKLEEKRQVLEKLYMPLNAKAAATEEGAKVQFYARYTFDAKKFASDAGDLFDLRKSVLRGEQAFIDAGKRFWDGILGGLPNPDFKIVEALANSLQKRGEEARPIKEQLRGSKTTRDFNNWLYSLGYYDVEYGIKYDDTDLDKLSPGKKGVVLLLIYLTIDKDYRPLIIDQPEENLDNRSVYSTLVEYFRKAKKNRQVIIVTHNANLVVNGDAEQIVVANFEKDHSTQPARIKYVAGPLEDSRPPTPKEKNVLDRQGVREHVCELLEGGETAFERREEKYGFPK